MSGFNDEIKEMIDGMDMNSPPPENEPYRQYWFIKKCREIVKKKSDEIGRPLSACTVTMGCQMNTEHGKRKAAKTAAFSYGVVFGDEGERKKGDGSVLQDEPITKPVLEYNFDRV